MCCNMKYLTVYDLIKKRPDFKQQQVGALVALWEIVMNTAVISSTGIFVAIVL